MTLAENLTPQPWQLTPAGPSSGSELCARAGQHLDWEQQKSAELATQQSAWNRQTEGGTAPMCLGAPKEERAKQEEQEETGEGNSAAWRQAVELDAWASP